MFAAVLAIYRHRLRALSPTAQRFAKAEGLITPGPFVRSFVLLVVFIGSLVGVMMELLWLRLTPTRAAHWRSFAVLFVAPLLVCIASGRALRRMQRRRS